MLLRLLVLRLPAVLENLLLMPEMLLKEPKPLLTLALRLTELRALLKLAEWLPLINPGGISC